MQDVDRVDLGGTRHADRPRERAGTHERRQSLARPFGKIIGINNWLQSYAKENDLPFVNFYEAMAVGRNLRPELSEDGRLPNEAGYAVMAELVESAIAKVVTSSSGR